MKFSKDLFISYTHIDNQRLEGQELGWVSRFHDTLKALLEMRLGEAVEIWWDNKLAGNDDFSEEIMVQFKDVALLVSILSPRYLKSEWCMKEARAFCQAALESGGLEIRRKLRIFTVYKLPVDSLKNLPNEFNKVLGFPFYTSKNGVPIELDPAYGHEMVCDFNLNIAILAEKLAQTAKVLRSTDKSAEPVIRKATVYLAETSWEREPERKKLESELSGREYQVVPEANLPGREQDYLRESGTLLNGCALAVHMVGSQPGMVPNGPRQKSVEELQNELAGQQSRSRNLPRIIWMPDGTRSTNDAHGKFLESLATDEDAQLGADVVTGDFEALKAAVLSKLQSINRQQNAKSDSPAASTGGNSLYILCDRRDIDAIRPLRQALRSRGCEARRPLFEGDASAIRTQNEQFLGSCRGAVVYYGAADEQWYVSTMAEVQKINRRVPLWTYVGPPSTAHKQELLDVFEGELIINGLGQQFPEGELDQLAAAVKPARTAAGGLMS